MPRRRLRIHYSSDSEEEEPNQQQQSFNFPLNNEQSIGTPSPVELFPGNPNPNSDPVPITVDEDDQYWTPPSPQATIGSMIADSLSRLGLSLKREWLDSCVQGLERSVSGFSELDVAVKAKLCFQQFLFSDMNYSGAGVLPQNVHSMHVVDLKGPFVLQVDEIVNINCPLQGRYQDAPSGIKRCLKLSMTDGIQRLFGMEYKPIKDLKVLAPAGLKMLFFPGFWVVMCNVHIRRGLLMLVPEALEVLGGMVEELNVARQHLVDEVNKPPRGKRTRTGVFPSLVARATLAAWHSNGVRVTGNANNLPSQNSTPFQENEQGANSVASGFTISQRTTVVPVNVENAMLYPSSNVVMDDEEMHIDTFPISRDNDEFNSNTNVVMDNSNTNVVMDIEDTHMVDEVEHPLVLSGDREIPFTYLASLSAKWAATKGKASSIQGKIKCFLTGVKKFQYKGRERYELFVYVDDGSLICEILIDHNVVQKGIGYSPQEVTAALSSLDVKKVSDMKEIFRQFQLFLVNFEGTMLVDMNETLPHPIALEIMQGCPSSDAWLLLRMFKFRPANAQTPPHPSVSPPMDPINISP